MHRIQGRSLVPQLQRNVAMDSLLEVRSWRWDRRLRGKADHKTGGCTPNSSQTVGWLSIKLSKGTDGACGDDAAGLKTAVIGWLMANWPTPEPALEPRYKTGHGFYHDTTARLICLVDYNWSNPRYICSFLCMSHSLICVVTTGIEPTSGTTILITPLLLTVGHTFFTKTSTMILKIQWRGSSRTFSW